MNNTRLSLSDRTALITGGSRGIGAAIAEAYAVAGAAVVVNFVSRSEAADAVVARIAAAGGRAVAVQADVGDVTQHARLLDEAMAAFGPVHILVNNAGVEERKDILDYSPEDWDWQMKTASVAGLSTSLPPTKPGPCPATRSTTFPRRAWR